MGATLSLALPILFLAAVLQSSFVPQVRVFGGAPDLVFLIVLSWAVDRDLDEGLVWAFVGGILQDLLSAAPTGASTLGMIPMLFVIYLLNRQVYSVGLLTIPVLFFAGTFVKEGVLAVVMAIAGYASNPVNLVSYVILPTALYNVAVGFLVFGLVRWMQRRLRPTTRVLQ